MKSIQKASTDFGERVIAICFGAVKISADAAAAPLYETPSQRVRIISREVADTLLRE